MAGRRIGADVLLALMLAGPLSGVAAGAASAADTGNVGSTPAPTGMEDMPGMDHGTGATDMPGMDHGTGATDMPGMDHTHHGGTGAPTPDHPLGLVLGGFGVGSAGVLASAALLRRRDAATGAAKLARAHPRKARS